jgi:hypothetical protein
MGWARSGIFIDEEAGGLSHHEESVLDTKREDRLDFGAGLDVYGLGRRVGYSPVTSP